MLTFRNALKRGRFKSGELREAILLTFVSRLGKMWGDDELYRDDGKQLVPITSAEYVDMAALQTKDVMEQLHKKVGTVSRIIVIKHLNKLLKAGLIERCSSSTLGRSVKYRLSSDYTSNPEAWHNRYTALSAQDGSPERLLRSIRPFKKVKPDGQPRIEKPKNGLKEFLVFRDLSTLKYLIDDDLVRLKNTLQVIIAIRPLLANPNSEPYFKESLEKDKNDLHLVRKRLEDSIEKEISIEYSCRKKNNGKGRVHLDKRNKSINTHIKAAKSAIRIIDKVCTGSTDEKFLNESIDSLTKHLRRDKFEVIFP